MKEKKTHPLNFQTGFEDSRPDAYHHVDFKYAAEWIREKRILNVGCWTGSFESLSSELPKKAFGLDQDINALKMAGVSHPNVSFANGDLFELPFQDNTFDVVLLFTVFEHLGGKERVALDEINRVLTPSGKFCRLLTGTGCMELWISHTGWSTIVILALMKFKIT